MTKELLNNREDFENWKKSNSRHILIENDEVYPNNYPCIVVDKYIEDNYYMDNSGFVYYTFIYLNDFTKDK